MSKEKPVEIKIALQVLNGLDKSWADYKDLQKLLPLLAIKRGKAGLEVSKETLQGFAAQGSAAIETAISELDSADKNAAKPTYESVVAKLRAAASKEDEKEASPSLIGVTDLSKMKELIEAGADIDEDNSAPLINAARNGALDIVEFLIEQGARNHPAALAVAAEKGYLAVIKHFDRFKGPPYIFQVYDQTIRNGHTEVAAHLFKTYIKEELHEKPAWALNMAASLGHLDIIKQTHEARPKASLDCPLSDAIRKNHPDCAAYLLEKGAVPDLWALDRAVETGNLNLVKLLVQHGVPVMQLAYGISAVQRAAKKGHINILEYLIEQGADIDDRRGLSRPLILAIRNKDLPTVKWLVERGADIHADNNDAIKTAACYDWDIVTYLRNKGADFEETKDNLFLTAARQRNLLMVKALVKQGANIEAYDNEAYRYAAYEGHVEVVDYLFSNGVDVNYDFNETKPCLQTAAYQGKLEMVKCLIEHGADIHADNDAALIDAIENKHLPVVKYLVEQGADIYADNGRPLSQAMVRGNYPVEKYLVEKALESQNHTDFIHRDFFVEVAKENDTALLQRLIAKDLYTSDNLEAAIYWASVSGSYNAVEYLLEQGAKGTQLGKSGREKLANYRLWQEKFPDAKKPENCCKLNPYHFKEEAFWSASEMIQAEGYTAWHAEDYAYNLSALFQTEERILRYLERWGDGQRKQPLHDISQMIQIPEKGRPNLVAWGDAVLKHGPKMARLVKFADKLPEPAQSTLNVGQDKDTIHKTWSYTKTYDKVAQFAYKRGKQNPELAKLCFNFVKSEDNFNDALKLVQQYQEKYAANDNHKPGGRIPDIKIDGKVFKKPGYELYKLPDGDVRGLLLGEFTNCCQSVGGVGSACAKHGYLSKQAGFYVVEDKKKKQIIAQSWAWRGKGGGLVLDSIESLKGHFNQAQWGSLVETLADKFKKQADITGFYIGKGGATPDLPYEKAEQPEKPVDYDGYRDSIRQYCVFKR